MRKIILGLFIALFCFTLAMSNYQEKELSEEEKAILKKAIEIIKKHKERELLELMREASAPKEKDDLSWMDEYPDIKKEYEERKGSWQDITPRDEKYLAEVKAETDRIEDLLRKLRNERYQLDSDMAWHRLEIQSSSIMAYDMFRSSMETDLLLDSIFGRSRYYPTHKTTMWGSRGYYTPITIPSYKRYSTQQPLLTNYWLLYWLLK